MNHLPYLEIHVADHCNLRCRRCGHFANIAPPWLVAPSLLHRDLQRLAQLVPSIRTIRLLGGEPLLHPTVHEIMHSTRETYPDARIILLTNGLRLLDMGDAFWSACRETETQIGVTIYPPLGYLVESWRAKCRAERVHFGGSRAKTFGTWLNPRGDSDPSAAWSTCHERVDCPLLRDGHVYPCATAAMGWAYADRFGVERDAVDGYDLHADDASATSLLEYLTTPLRVCRWCSEEDRTRHAWEAGHARAEDWER